jgi:hypothetical protein
MWRHVRRRTLAPRRPPLFPEQYALALATAIVLVAGMLAVLYALLHG